LPRYAKLVVVAILVLLFLGGLVTSFGAGMAVPDWPLSFGSLNPHGWWGQLPVRLEHGHRLTAICVGFLVGGLCAWVWQRWIALLLAIVVSAVLPPIAALAHAPAPVIMHLAIWPAAATFIALILIGSGRRAYSVAPRVRWFTFALYVCVCIQATLGGLRVTTETAKEFGIAMVLRIAHGSFAQIFVMSLAVAVAVLLSPVWRSLKPLRAAKGLSKLGWVVFGILLVQLVFGATMRHMGAGLAIPSFPKISPAGGWLPAVHNAYVDTNFTHTRVFALLATIMIVTLAIRVIRAAHDSALSRPAWALLALVLIQVTLGVLVIQIQTPPVEGLAVQFLSRQVQPGELMDAMRLLVGTIKTVHMLNGAITLATSLLLAIRLSGAGARASGLHIAGENHLTEAAV